MKIGDILQYTGTTYFFGKEYLVQVIDFNSKIIYVTIYGKINLNGSIKKSDSKTIYQLAIEDWSPFHIKTVIKPSKLPEFL